MYVTCNYKTTKGSFSIHVNDEWAPLGAARFLELVDVGFYTDVYFFRVALNFLTQFGAVEKVRRKRHK
jgi:cyclophilin family peptidyl-prolyl cis-trans isomerase